MASCSLVWGKLETQLCSLSLLLCFGKHFAAKMLKES